MISSNFDYINILSKVADASHLKHQVISNNIANQDTPGYKRKDVDFERVLERELTGSKYTSLDQKLREIHLGHLDVTPYTDSASYSYRLDGNNVDPEQEHVGLAATQIKYNAMIDTINGKFSSLKSVLK